MQLKDLVTPIRDMTDEELREKLRSIRHNRTVVRPAAAKKTERTEKKESRAKVSAVDKLLDGLSPEQKAELIKQLGG